MQPRSSRREYERGINRVIDHIQAHLADDLTLERLAGVAAFSPFHFHRLLAAITGEALSDFICRVRLERAAGALTLDTSVLELARRYVFSSAATLARAFKIHFGRALTSTFPLLSEHQACRPHQQTRSIARDPSPYLAEIVNRERSLTDLN